MIKEIKKKEFQYHINLKKMGLKTGRTYLFYRGKYYETTGSSLSEIRRLQVSIRLSQKQMKLSFMDAMD